MVHRFVDGKLVELTAAEVTSLEADRAKAQSKRANQKPTFIKRGASDRIARYAPVQDQLTTLFDMVDMAIKVAQGEQLSPAESARLTVHQKKWAEIKRLNQKSEDLINMQTIPDDFYDDKHWQEVKKVKVRGL